MAPGPPIGLVDSSASAQNDHEQNEQYQSERCRSHSVAAAAAYAANTANRVSHTYHHPSQG